MESKEEWKKVGERIRQARDDKGLTQEQLLQRMEPKRMSPSTLSIVENGGRESRPRSATIQRIADALGVKFEDLLRSEPEPEELPSPTEELPSPTLQDIRDMLLRYEPLRGMDNAVDRICEQIQLWTAFRGTRASLSASSADD